jgi:cell wall-associated NlpC family hydrolase
VLLSEVAELTLGQIAKDLAEATRLRPELHVPKALEGWPSWCLDVARGILHVYDGCSASGIECSCFVQTIFRFVGIGLPRTSQLQYNATVGRGFGTSSPEPGDVVFFFRTYSDPGQDWTHVGVVSRIDSNGTVWMIDAPGARAAGDPPDAPFGQVREEPVAGSWLQHRPTYARIPY